MTHGGKQKFPHTLCGSGRLPIVVTGNELGVLVNVAPTLKIPWQLKIEMSRPHGPQPWQNCKLDTHNKNSSHILKI